MEASSMVERTERREGSANQGSEELSSGMRGMWAAVADGWAAHADYADARGASITDAMLSLASPASGERVLELACGPAGVGLAAAHRVGPTGEVVLSDLVPQMTSIAAARATARRLRNVRTCELDLDRIEQPDGSYDVVLCREGLMFAADPGRAVREMGRVLRPGGRIALAVWGPPARNPWLAIVLDAVSTELRQPVPPLGVPGPFALADPHRLAGLLADAALVDVAVTEVSSPVHAASVDEWWSRTSSLAGPLARRLALLSDQAAEALRERVRAAVSAYITPTGLEFPGVALIASGRRR